MALHTHQNGLDQKDGQYGKCCGRCREVTGFLHCWWVRKLVQPPWKTVEQFLTKLNLEFCMTQKLNS